MSQSLSQLYIHIIFHVNHHHVAIRSADALRIYSYVSALLKQDACLPIRINGTHDHIHIFCTLSKNITLSQLLQHIKSRSSQWIKSIDPYYRKFAWQKGYGAFSVSQSIYEKTIAYIENQQEHHKKRTYQDEYLMFLKEYRVEYESQYLWED